MDSEYKEALRAAAGTLESRGIDYFLFGANAQNIWGDPRFTTDVDLIVFAPDNRFQELLDALLSAGFRVDPPMHLDHLRRSRLVKLSYRRITTDFVLGETEFDQSALARRCRVTYLDIPLFVGSAEDIILYKLIAHRGRDLGDLESIIRRQRNVLDRAYLRKWAKWLAENTGLERIRTTLRSMLRQFGQKPRR